jgi:hypothetical protein
VPVNTAAVGRYRPMPHFKPRSRPTWQRPKAGDLMCAECTLMVPPTWDLPLTRLSPRAIKAPGRPKLPPLFALFPQWRGKPLASHRLALAFYYSFHIAAPRDLTHLLSQVSSLELHCSTLPGASHVRHPPAAGKSSHLHLSSLVDSSSVFLKLVSWSCS